MQQELQWMQLDARRVTLSLTREDLRRIYRTLLRTRLIDERMASLQARGLIAGSPTCRGHEAAQVGCIEPLHVSHDYILPYYRDLGIMVAIGMSPYTLLLNQLGRQDDPISGGRMRPAQWNSREYNVVSASGLIATQTLHAAGIAFAAKLRGDTAIALTCFGEGATSEGDFHEALNFAGVHQLGVIFLCENNGIALSTPQALQMRAEHVADRAAGYGMPGVVVDGSDVLAVIDAAREAFARARGGQGPTLLEIIVPHLAPDNAALDDMRDPVALMRAYLLKRGDLALDQDQQLHQHIIQSIDEAERAAMAAAAPDPATVGEQLFAAGVNGNLFGATTTQSMESTREGV